MFVGGEAALVRAILGNIVGFDINPLAVLASRTNYLIAIRDLLVHMDEIEIPVFLADFVATPTEYGDLFSSASAVARVPCAAVKPPFLHVPREVGADMETVRAFTAAIEHALKVESSGSEFVAECRSSGVPVRNEKFLHLRPYSDRNA